MKKIGSNQRNVQFSYCKEPVTIDKSSSWGEGNIQNFPSGVYLKHNDEGNITHGVQPNDNNTAPIGWTKDVNGYKKLPIWIGERLEAGTKRKLLTLDGEIDYNVSEESYICYNGEFQPNLLDAWIQPITELQTNYIL